jgi:5-methylcytosine-specific restriction protein A
MQSPLVPVADLRTALPAPKQTEPIYGSQQWKQLVAKLIRERGRRCQDCGATGGRIYADHIRELRDGGEPFAEANLRLRCARCHGGKTEEEKLLRLRSP